MRRVLVVCALLVPNTLVAQTGVTGSAALVPDSFAVGDVVLAAVRVRLPPGVRVEFPDTLAISGDTEGAGNRLLRSDTTDGAIELTAAYPVTAWKPGPLQLPDTPVRVLREDGVDTLFIAFPEAHVATVLPADTAGVQPRPARDVLGPNRLWWPLLVALLVATVLVAALLVYWNRRRAQPVPVPAPPGVSPRAAALSRLDRVRTERMIEQGRIKQAYTVIAEAVRGYLDALDHAWGVELTTTELSVALSLREADAWDALDVLTRAYLVKFARADMPAETAHADWDRVRAWVQRFGPADVEAEMAEVA